MLQRRSVGPAVGVDPARRCDVQQVVVPEHPEGRVHSGEDPDRCMPSAATR